MRHITAVVATVLVSLALLAGGPPPRAEAAGYTGPGLVALKPARLLDTRSGTGAGPLAGATSRQVKVVGVGGTAPSGVSAVVLTLTAVSPQRDGYLSVYPSGSSRPQTSNLNVTSGRDVAGEVVVAPGADGNVTVWTSAPTHLLVDVAGYYPPGSSYQPVTASRVLDTRGGARPGDDDTTSVAVTGRAGVPSSGVAAVAVNVTATGADAPGYVSAWRSDGSRTNTSLLSYAPGKTVAAFAVVQPGADGRVAVFTRTAAHLIVDIVGWYAAGREFHTIDPIRLADSRVGTGVTKARIPAGGSLTLTVGGRGGIPTTSLAAVQVSLAAVGPSANGYLTLAPTGVARPVSSTLNFQAGSSLAAPATVMTGYGGTLTLYASAETDVLLDVTGYSTTAPPSGAGLDLWTAYADTPFFTARGAGLRGTLPLALPVRGVLSQGWVRVSSGPYAGAYIDGGKLSPTSPAVTLAEVTSAIAQSPVAAPGSTVTRYVVMTNFTINVRATPSTTGAIKGQLGNGSKLTGQYVDRAWFKITTGSYAGSYVTSGELQLGADQSLVNGRLPRSDVCLMPSYFSNTRWEPWTPRFLNCVALASLVQLDKAFVARFGYHLQIDEGYRSLTKQQYFYDLWGYPSVAYPGTSTHGLGLAIDVYAEDDSQYTWGTPVDTWLTANATNYGWDRPPYYDSPGGSSEYWHYNYVG